MIQSNLGIAGFWLEGVWGGLMPLLQTHADLVPRSHLSLCKSHAGENG